jgi:hypothetical protein
MNEIKNKKEKKKVLVSLYVEDIERLTTNGKTIQDVIRIALELFEKNDRPDLSTVEKTKTRVTMKLITRVMKLCQDKGLKIEVPDPSDTPLIIVDYGRNGKEPEIIRVSSLADVYDYLENAWRESVMNELSRGLNDDSD